MGFKYDKKTFAIWQGSGEAYNSSQIPSCIWEGGFTEEGKGGWKEEKEKRKKEKGKVKYTLK